MRPPMTQPLRAMYGNTWLRLALALLGALVVLACGATPMSVKTAPARDLELSVTLAGEYATGDGLVQMRVDISDPSKGGFVALSGGQRLTCDGVSGPTQGAGGGWWTAYFSVPRQPPGSAYTCVYMDERGQHTTATINIPPGQFAITSPAAGAHVPIPGPLGLKATVTPSPNPERGAWGVDQPLVIRYVSPTPPGYVGSPPGHMPPEGPYASVTAGAGCGDIPPAVVQCPPQHGGEQQATGVYFLSDAPNAPGYGFEQTVPGQGYIQLGLTMRWLAPAGGFRSIRVDTADQITIPITWTARTGSG